MQRKEAPEAFTVLFAGDWAPIRAFDEMIAVEPGRAYGDLLPRLRAADLRVVNCECALTQGGRPVWKSGSVFKGRPVHVRGLAAAGIEAACLANNHVLDYGTDGLAETLEHLHRAGIRTLGAGLTEEQAWAPLSLELGGARLSLVNFSEGEDLSAARGGPGVAGWEVSRVCALVRALKARGDCVVVVAHAGLEYVPFPPPYVQKAFRAVLDAGADALAAHHAHVPQGIELYQGRPIAYCLGNFLFYQPTDLYWRKVGYLLELELVQGRLRRFRTIPYHITEAGLAALGPEKEAEFRRALEKISTPLAETGGCERAWEAYLQYYGADGLRQELESIVVALKSEPPKGAAMLRNRLTTPQHAELWRDLLRRLVAGGPEPSLELLRITAEWLERRRGPDQQAGSP